jgi:hypothetical protein
LCAGTWRFIQGTENSEASAATVCWIRDCKGEARNAYRILVNGPLGRHELGIPRKLWDNIKLDLREIRVDCEGGK